jgi:hypothetical protein
MLERMTPHYNRLNEGFKDNESYLATWNATGFCTAGAIWPRQKRLRHVENDLRDMKVKRRRQMENV